MKYSNFSGADFQFSQPASSLFPEERTKNEVAIIRYLGPNANFVSSIIHVGKDDRSRYKLGPFIMMSHISHSCNMYETLVNDCGYLDSDIYEDQSRVLYTRMANILCARHPGAPD